MLSAFFTSYEIKNTYRVNSIIYTLKHLPLIGKLLPATLYKCKPLKIFSNVISAIMEVLSIFLWKYLYILIMLMCVIPYFNNQSGSFLTIIIFLTIIGGFLNTQLFSPSMDKYYAIMLMKFDAKKYILVNYLYFLFKILLGFLPTIIYFGLKSGLNILTCLLIPIYVISIKNIFNYFSLKDDKQNKKNESKYIIIVFTLSLVLLGIAYGLPYFNIYISEELFYIISIIVFGLGLYSFIYILKFNNYYKVYKNSSTQLPVTDDNTKKTAELYNKSITNKNIIAKNIKGYEYFNDLFVQRHSKILTTATKRVSIISIIVIIIFTILCIINSEISSQTNEFLKNSLPYFLFVMYFINHGQNITQTMFMNCDHSMLFYRFYRQPGSILKLFKERLKTLIKLNMIPGLIIAVGVDLLLYISGGTEITEYIITFLTIVSMSVFFSIHYLVLYYLLQPYDINLEIKNPLFLTICSLTYLVCYFAIKVVIPTIYFGTGLIIFTILYSLISLFLAYEFAPKTFKLRN